MRSIAFILILCSLSVYASESLMGIVSQKRKWEIKSGSNAENCPSPLIIEIENNVNSFAGQSLPAGDVFLALRGERGMGTSYAMFPGTSGEPVRLIFREKIQNKKERTLNSTSRSLIPGIGYVSAHHQSFLTDSAEEIQFENTSSVRMNFEKSKSREVLHFNKRTNEINITVSQSGISDISCSYQLAPEVVTGPEVVDGDRHLGGDREGSSSSSSSSRSSRATEQ